PTTRSIDPSLRLRLLLPVIDAHRAPQKVHDLYIFQSQFAHFHRDARLSRIMLQRFEDISVSVRTAAKNPSQPGDEHFQIAKIEIPPETIFGLAEIKNQQAGAWFSDTKHLVKT